MEDRNARIAAMQAEVQETIAKRREDLTARLRVEEAANKVFVVLGLRCLLDCHVLKGFGIYMIGILDRLY